MSDAVTLFRALSNPARLRIVELLVEGERCVCELQPAIDLAQPTVSLHLRALERDGIVSSHKRGRKVFYALADERVESIIGIAQEVIR